VLLVVLSFNESFNPSISADGRYMAFLSSANDLVSGDTNGTYDAFVKDLQTGAITRVSTEANGSQGNSDSIRPSVSADGRYVAFTSGASTLLPGDTNNAGDVFLAPTGFGAVSVFISENSTAVMTVTATDPDAGETLRPPGAELRRRHYIPMHGHFSSNASRSTTAIG
jgi:WD40-like Beta Propeller Repeat